MKMGAAFFVCERRLRLPPRGGDMTRMQMTLLKRVEELTLYTLEQEDRISTQDARIAMQEDRIARLEAAQ